MSAIELILGVSLALDCFAIAITQGLREIPLKNLFILALCFGGFQGGMLLLGHFGSLSLAVIFKVYMPYIASALLLWIGSNMIREGLPADINPSNMAFEGLKSKDFITLSLATSIDALAAGLSISALGLRIVSAFVYVAVSSFFLTLLGGHFGRRLGAALGQRSELVGGCVLCILGLKVLFFVVFS